MFQPAAILPAATVARAPRTVRAGSLLGALLAVFVADDLLLVRFLGLAATPWLIAGALAGVAICAMAYREMTTPIPMRRIAWCMALGALLVLLGGEGRLFYANPDWQVRDAVLADMVRLPWPFVYVGHGAPLLLRAPIGMYLLPALAGKLAGQSVAAWALALQNGAVLGAILALGSLLADRARDRHVLAIVTIGFGGLDTLGAALTRPARLWPLTRDIENWAPTILPSPVSSLFWTPQHAVAGFAGALMFLLWRIGRAPLWSLLAIVPLAALWSPLGAIGTLPFAAWAGLATLLRWRLRPVDIALAIAALVPAALALVYLSGDAARVGMQWAPLPVPVYLAFEAIEVAPFALGVAMLTRGGRFGPATLALVVAMLAVSPLIAVGESVDFTMRASIPALAIVSVLAADALVRAPPGGWRTMLAVALAIGALAPARDVARAFAMPPPPPALCDFWGAWDQSFATFGKETYLARLAAMPSLARPVAPAAAPPLAPVRCWSRAWKTPRF